MAGEKQKKSRLAKKKKCKFVDDEASDAGSDLSDCSGFIKYSSSSESAPSDTEAECGSPRMRKRERSADPIGNTLVLQEMERIEKRIVKHIEKQRESLLALLQDIRSAQQNGFHGLKLVIQGLQGKQPECTCSKKCMQ